MAGKIKVLLVDDHTILRNTLRILLEKEQEIQIVGEAGDGKTGVAMSIELKPDVVIMDITLPDHNGVEACRLICTQLPQIKVIALTMHVEREYLTEFLAAGGAGYLHKSVADHELLQAIHTVMKGEIFLCPAGVQVIAQQHRVKPAHGDIEPDILSERELQVLKYVAKGHTSAEIGEKLYLSPRTIDTYRARIIKKLNIPNRSQLVDYVMRYRLLDK
ncbi:two component transcriptional regulator, LuxR family [Desulfitobacterium chlororespirans DSM 11544]|uniref:Stage 0 sporulation protein A homolog n=2 Tax=Desulfitobacterium chlororespirans TaxID=51616 RepID=A0A1M7UCN6_9FIRM|nr:two component transcriptional regulator, LuxR family [Desulfitobacterium chlororespirans DSM 11544]